MLESYEQIILTFDKCVIAIFDNARSRKKRAEIKKLEKEVLSGKQRNEKENEIIYPYMIQSENKVIIYITNYCTILLWLAGNASFPKFKNINNYIKNNYSLIISNLNYLKINKILKNFELKTFHSKLFWIM